MVPIIQQFMCLTQVIVLDARDAASNGSLCLDGAETEQRNVCVIVALVLGPNIGLSAVLRRQASE